MDMEFDQTFTGVSQLIIFHETNIAMSLRTEYYPIITLKIELIANHQIQST